MENWEILLDKKETYIIGVSGGPDSMALLDMCKKQGYSLVVAHMNYQKRDSALRDEEIVRKYCEENGIPCVIRKQNKTCQGNFQAFAREERYRFYKELLDEYKAQRVLLAHHLDDHLETYLMQKQRKSQGEWHGIKEKTEIFGCPIFRPLLSFTKAQLEMYCKKQGVEFGIDESNLTDDYTRNKIRHEQIEHMTMEEKLDLAQKIQEENERLLQENKKARHFLSQWDFDVSSLLELDENLRYRCLFLWIKDKTKTSLSAKQLSKIQQLLYKKDSWEIPVKDKILYQEYGKLDFDDGSDISYAYEYNSLKYGKTPYFEISKTGRGVEALTLSEKDFPITIRNVKEADRITLRFGTKKVHRWFIDRKIPRKQRKVWPVVVNAANNIVLVPGIGCDIAHFSNNPNIFVLK